LAIEVELRARFDQDTHDKLVAHLTQTAEDLGQDDKHIYFYVLPDQLLKVTDNIAAGTAKITLKESKIGQGSAFPETEFPIARGDIEAAVRIFNALGFKGAMHEAFNSRHNFRLDGVEIAVKWSEAWGHHAEFEVLLDNDASEEAKAEAVERIQSVATDVGVKLMTEQELAAFTAAFEAAEAERKAAQVTAH
jgi:predicted adenylyl cyclase CyaB